MLRTPDPSPPVARARRAAFLASSGRLLLAALAATAAFGPLPARAQDRRLDAHPGGPVALCSRPFAWTAEEARAFTGERSDERRGGRVVLALVETDAADPLAASPLPVQRFVLDPKSPHAGDAREPSSAVADAAVVELVGGTWLAWWQVLLPNDKAARLALALQEAHRRGTPILGTGAAAGFLAAACPVARSELARAVRNRHRPDPDTALGGLGLVRTTFDADALAGGSLERGLRSLLRSGTNASVFLLGDAAWIVEERAERAHLLAHDGGLALVVDVDSARRMRESLREGRITRLGPGDAWDLARRRALPERPRWTPGPSPASAPPDRRAVPDPLDAAALGRVLERGSGLVSAVWTSARAELVLACDEDTEGGEHEPFARVRFDILWEFPEPVR